MKRKSKKVKGKNVLTRSLPEKSALIICNGDLSKKLVQRFMKPQKQHMIIAADGASDFLFKHKILPDYIAGDLDSITYRTKKYFSDKKVKIIRIIDQNKNDFEKCLMIALRKKITKMSVVGLSGKRFDHTLNNLSILKKYHSTADIICYDEQQEYFFIKKKIVFECEIGDVVSLLAFPKASGIYTNGLKYPLKNGTLEFGVFQGALNHAISKTVRVEFKKGALMMFKTRKF